MTDIETIVKIIENYSPELAAEEILRLFSVVGRSEQLVCDHPVDAIIKDKSTDYCMACNRNI